MKSADIRSSFLNYFKNNDHAILPSSSLIPHNDPTIMFNNAGMNQFKSIFLGTETPQVPRATTSQKCVRAGGKHNDLDNVGFTARHHTFFEMLGNFSFGDYFKEEAIEYAWNFLTKELNLDPKKLYVTAFHTDLEAKKLWLDKMGIPKDHFSTFGEKDNFWRMGDVGPCGPCSEIFYDFGEKMGTGPENVVGGNGDRFIEIWNLVFMQFHETNDGQTPLPNPSIDTGMGLERLSMLLQDKTSNYETDLFLPIIENASKLLKTPYDLEDPKRASDRAALRVLADHARAISFLIADGVLPSNEGRGYVLRRILRRAVRFNHKLSDNAILPALCTQVIEMMTPFYPELKDRSKIILDNVINEETNFLSTIDKGEALLEKELLALKGSKTLSGESAFKLYDTFGFPVDLTKIILTEKGYSLDEDGFDKKLAAAKAQAKSGSKKGSISFDLPNSIKDSIGTLNPTAFTGYENLKGKGTVLEIHTSLQGSIKTSSDENFYLISDSTPFYAESGGQVGDRGTISTGSSSCKVLDVKKLDKLFIHLCKKTSRDISVGDKINLAVNKNLRNQTEQNHSATHLLHAALIKVCGSSVQQAGSSVDENKIRFDFSHKGPVSKTDLKKVEDLVNQEILNSNKVQTDVMDIESAKKAGAQALFGEKYEADVRVLSMGAFSKELCGGTHVSSTSDISGFKIRTESGVSSGVRRIEAITGALAFNFLNQKTTDFETLATHLGLNINATSDDTIKQITKLSDEIKNLKKKLKSGVSAAPSATQKINSKFGDLEICISHLENMERNDLRDAADKARDKMKGFGVCIFTASKTEKGFPILISKTKNLDGFNSGSFLRELTGKLGGKGGGKPDFAQGTVEDIKQLEETSLNLLK